MFGESLASKINNIPIHDISVDINSSLNLSELDNC